MDASKRNLAEYTVENTSDEQLLIDWLEEDGDGQREFLIEAGASFFQDHYSTICELVNIREVTAKNNAEAVIGKLARQYLFDHVPLDIKQKIFDAAHVRAIQSMSETDHENS